MSLLIVNILAIFAVTCESMLVAVGTNGLKSATQVNPLHPAAQVSASFPEVQDLNDAEGSTYSPLSTGNGVFHEDIQQYFPGPRVAHDDHHVRYRIRKSDGLKYSEESQSFTVEGEKGRIITLEELSSREMHDEWGRPKWVTLHRTVLGQEAGLASLKMRCRLDKSNLMRRIRAPKVLVLLDKLQDEKHIVVRKSADNLEVVDLDMSPKHLTKPIWEDANNDSQAVMNTPHFDIQWAIHQRCQFIAKLTNEINKEKIENDTVAYQFIPKVLEFVKDEHHRADFVDIVREIARDIIDIRERREFEDYSKLIATFN
jgi:hypothetical protein